MNCDIASIQIARPVDKVFAFMSDPARMDQWSFGTWRTKVAADGLVFGTSIMDGAPICVRIKAHPEQGLIDYLIGPSPKALVPRIYVRIVPASNAGAAADQSILMMVAMRDGAMSDARWQGLKTAHAFEIELIKSALETGYDHRMDRG
ncbi:MAG: hypothetical protein ACI8Q6_002693 [Granulosicoccus sp.]|jgi:hypothetical protein